MALAAPARADVTITSTNSGKGLGQTMGGQSTTYIKGTKMRTDQTIRGDVLTTIIDVENQRMISINAKQKEAEIHDLSKTAAEISKNVKVEGMKVEMKPNGQTKQILGVATAGYDLSILVPMTMGDQTIDVNLAGPVWIAKDAAGAADYATFYRAAAQKGLFFTNPDQAKASPAQAKGMAEMYRAMADLGGVPYETEIGIKFGGQGMMASMMNKIGGVSILTTVTAVSTDPIADEMFAVPAGFKTRNR